MRVEYSTDGRYAQHIHAAFSAASAALLDLVTTEAGLRNSLAALKGYFLLARGDLFTVFLDIAEAELAKNAGDVILTRLQSLLELGVLDCPGLQDASFCSMASTEWIATIWLKCGGTPFSPSIDAENHPIEGTRLLGRHLKGLLWVQQRCGRRRRAGSRMGRR